MKGLFKSFAPSLKSLRPERWTHTTSADSVIPISLLHWFLPLFGSLLAIGYVVFEEVFLQKYSILAPNVVRTLLVVGMIGPSVAWVALGWAERATAAATRIQQDLAYRNRELAALNVIGDAAAQSLDSEEITQTALAKMLELLDLDSAEVRLVERDMLVLKAQHGVSPDFIAKERVLGFGQCLCGKCAKAGQVQVVRDLQTNPTFASTSCAKEGFQSSLSIPMKSKGRVVGVIHVASRERDAFPPENRETLISIANRVATAVENSILYEQAKRRAIQLETTSLIGQRLTSLLDPNPLLSEVVRLVREKFGYYHVGILLLDEKSNELIIKEVSRQSPDPSNSKGRRLIVGKEGITGWVAHTGQAFLCNDVSREPRYASANPPNDTRAELAVPLRVGDRVTGVLDVQSNRVNVFNKEDITFLQIVGNQLGIALENARLFQETRQRYEALLALHETSLEMISQLDMPELLQGLLRRGVGFLGAHGAALFLYDPARGTISCAAGFNSSIDWTKTTVHLGEGVVGHVIESGKPLIVNDVTEWEGRLTAVEGDRNFHTRVMGVPLIWQQQVIGAISVLNRPVDRNFNQDDRWLLGLYADLATIAIKNAELHTQVKEFSQHLESKVVERTQELMKARDAINAQAQQLRSLLAKTIRIQEEEQARIARDMHDGVIQLITATKFELRAARVAAGETLAAPAQDKLNAAREVLDEMDKEIRRTIYDLHPAILDSVGLVPALEKFARRFQDVAGIACHIAITGKPIRLDPSTEIGFYRLAEEALQNVATHSNAHSATVTFEYQPDGVCMTVQDDGQGFDYRHWMENRFGNHLGLVGMQERVASLDGEMKIHSEVGHGTSVSFRLPALAEGVS